MSNLSYVSGTGNIPLLGKAIGEMFDETVERFPETDALIVIH